MSKAGDFLRKVSTAASTGRIPGTYRVGGASGSIPMDIRLSMDRDFKRAVTTWVSIGSAAIGIGIAAGIVIAKSRKGR